MKLLQNLSVLLLLIVVSSCSTISREEITSIYNKELVKQLNKPDPGEKGDYEVKNLLYASAYNPRRKEYKDPAILTESVDLSPYFAPQKGFLNYIGDHSGYTDSINKWHWGYDETEAPVNGIIWYPQTKSSNQKFPLVVIVHGNHDAYDVSEFGYNYLGEHLASRGYIMASIDENFINMRTDGRENDSRAVMILEHIKTILSWSDDPNSIFYNMIDRENIAVIGHSRGGEAAVLTSEYNIMANYPENGNVKWDWNFNIKGVVSLAPVEGHRPSNKGAVPRDCNYLLLHGGADGDVTTNLGLKYINRTPPPKGFEYYSFWINGANHAQFNQDWSKNQDPFATLKPFMITNEEQQRVTKATITAFLNVSFNRDSEYREFLRDYRKGRSWLPENIYLTTYRTGENRVIANFDEDAYITTLTDEEWESIYSGFDIYREQALAYDGDKSFFLKRNPLFRNNFENQETNGLYMKWNSRATAKFLNRGEEKESYKALGFDLSVMELPESEDVLNFTIDIGMADGTRERVVLTDYYLLPETPGTFIFPKKGYSFPEMTQRIEIPLKSSKSAIQTIEFIFDKTPGGEILLDNLNLIKGETNE